MSYTPKGHTVGGDYMGPQPKTVCLYYHEYLDQPKTKEMYAKKEAINGVCPKPPPYLGVLSLKLHVPLYIQSINTNGLITHVDSYDCLQKTMKIEPDL